ncbi:MAG: hypothetical protein ACE5F1_06005 [Planctomycetota bacterium]
MRGRVWVWLALASLRSMLGVWLLGLGAMAALGGAFLLLRRPELELLPPLRLAASILLELGSASLLCSLPLGIGLLTQRLRDGGELRALRSLPRPPFLARLATLAPLPLFLLIQGLLLHRAAPLDRLELWSGRALEAAPEVLARLLPDWSERLGSCGVAHAGTDVLGLTGVCLLHFEGAEQVLALHAEHLQLESVAPLRFRLRLRNGRAWRGDPQALGPPLDFEELHLLMSLVRSPEALQPKLLPSRVLHRDGERLLARQILLHGPGLKQRRWRLEVPRRWLAQGGLLLACLLASWLHTWRDPAGARRQALAYALPSLLALLFAPSLVRLLP